MSEGDQPGKVRIAPGAPFELLWVLHACEAGHELTGPFKSLEALRVELKEKLDAFWADGGRGFSEVVVLAHRSGTLLDATLDRFFERLEAAASMNVPAPSLLSETDDERRLIEDRLERLRSDPRLRSLYAARLKSAWSSLAAEAEARERAVSEAAAEWRRRLDSGATYMDLLERVHIWPGRPNLDELAAAAAAAGRLVLSPCWYGGEIHAVEFDGTVYLGRGIRRRDEDRRKKVATHVSAQLKALTDPTRVSILLSLAQDPASVTELAQRFRLSQPTISGHVQVLRDAGLLDERPSGRSLKLSASEADLRRLFHVAEGELVNFFRR